MTRSYDSEPLPPASLPTATPGLAYRSYEKVSAYVPDWNTETAASEGDVPKPDLSIRPRENDIGVLFEGYLQVPADGDYVFYLNTDTGAFVRLHDAQLIDADFGYAAGSEVQSGSIKLRAGYHPIRIHYRHANAAGHQLLLQWSGPGIAKQEIPASAYFQEGEAAPGPPSANPDNASTTGEILIDVLENDFDDGTPAALAIASAGMPAHGSVAIEGNALRYTPAPGFLGTDLFDYTITDGESTATAEVRVRVLPLTDLIWLPMDEDGGDTVHDALEQAAGTLSGFTGNPWVAGRAGNSLRFDGTDDRTTLGGKKGATGTAARTVTFWINANASQTSGNRPTVLSWGASNGSSAGTRFDINLNHTNGYRLRAEFNSSGLNFNTASLTDLRGAGWVHCAVVVPAGATVSQIQGYLNGQAASISIEPANAGNTPINTGAANDITIGDISDGGAGRTFAGMLDDVRIYSRALTGAEIAAMAAETAAESQRNPWFFRHSGNAHPDSAAWDDDTDGDGFSTLLEYALGGNPTARDTGIAPALSGGIPRTFSFTRRRSEDPASYHPESSENLLPGSWQTLGGASVTDHPGRGDLQVVTVPIPDGSKGFARLRFEP